MLAVAHVSQPEMRGNARKLGFRASPHGAVPRPAKRSDLGFARRTGSEPIQDMAPDLRLRGGGAGGWDDSYREAQDRRRAQPDRKGFLACGGQGPGGAGRAVADARKAERIAVVGSFSPGQGAKLVRDGVIREGFIWNPALAGEVIVHVGKMLIDGREPTDGMEIPGLGKVQVDRERRNIQGQKLEPINRQTIDRLVGLGL